MMLYPPVAELVEKVGSRYQLVNLVARRARALSITKEGEEPSERKPVSEAIDEVYTGRLTIVKDGQKSKKLHVEPEEKKTEEKPNVSADPEPSADAEPFADPELSTEPEEEQPNDQEPDEA